MYAQLIMRYRYQQYNNTICILVTARIVIAGFKKSVQPESGDCLRVQKLGRVSLVMLEIWNITVGSPGFQEVYLRHVNTGAATAAPKSVV